MIGIEFLIVIGIFLTFMFSSPVMNFPPNGMVVGDNFNFEYENGKIILSGDESFSSVIELGEGSSIDLAPGIYYWKVKNILRESEARNFSVESKVALEIKRIGEDYELQNRGNVDLDIKEYERRGGIVGRTILDAGESEKIEDAENKTYEGGEK